MDSTTSIPEVIASPTLLFRVGGGPNMYGCDISEAQEIIPLRKMTRLPGVPAYVRGLINMRGTIVTVIDLGVRLDPSQAVTTEGSILLVRHGERLVGVVVEEVLDVRVLDIDESDAAESGGAIVRGLATVESGAAVILDLDALITQVLLS